MGRVYEIVRERPRILQLVLSRSERLDTLWAICDPGRMDTIWEGIIPGIFEGYRGGRVYELSDGSCWRQECNTSEYVYREQPKARLLWNQSIGKMHLDVEGTSSVVWVTKDRGTSQMGCGAF